MDRHPVTKEPGGPLRIFPSGLAVARGIGDADAAQFVSPVPATSTVALARDAGWDCVLASDGVWDGLSHHNVVKLCRGAQSSPPQALAA